MTFEPFVSLNNAMLKFLVTLRLTIVSCGVYVWEKNSPVFPTLGDLCCWVSVCSYVNHHGRLQHCETDPGLSGDGVRTGSHSTVEANVEVTVVLLGRRHGHWGKQLSCKREWPVCSSQSCAQVGAETQFLSSRLISGGWSAFWEGRTWTGTHSVTHHGPWKRMLSSDTAEDTAVVTSDPHMAATSPPFPPTSSVSQKCLFRRIVLLSTAIPQLTLKIASHSNCFLL